MRLITRMDSEARRIDGVVVITPDDALVRPSLRGCSILTPRGRDVPASALQGRKPRHPAHRHAVRTCRTGPWPRGV